MRDERVAEDRALSFGAGLRRSEIAALRPGGRGGHRAARADCGSALRRGAWKRRLVRRTTRAGGSRDRNGTRRVVGRTSERMGALRHPVVAHRLCACSHVLGFRRFSLRGLAKARCEWDLVCLALNVKRLHVRKAT